MRPMGVVWQVSDPSERQTGCFDAPCGDERAIGRRRTSGGPNHAMKVALRLVYGKTMSWATATFAFTGMTVLLLWSSQVLSFRGRSVQVFVQTNFIIAAVLIAALFAILLPMQMFAIRLAAVSARQTGGTLLGALTGTASMSCCAPVILPSILSVLGFSGTTILSFNLTVERYWLPLATGSIILLSYSLVSVARSLELECSLPEWAAEGSEKKETSS
jgi:hypothetical protein